MAWEAGRWPGRLDDGLGGWTRAWEAGRGPGRLGEELGGWARAWEAGRGAGREATALRFLNMKGKNDLLLWQWLGIKWALV